jgi:hypothetical protein
MGSVLLVLNLNHNCIGLEGAQALAGAFRAGALPALETLDLWKNPLQGGGSLIGQALEVYP